MEERERETEDGHRTKYYKLPCVPSLPSHPPTEYGQESIIEEREVVTPSLYEVRYLSECQGGRVLLGHGCCKLSARRLLQDGSNGLRTRFPFLPRPRQTPIMIAVVVAGVIVAVASRVTGVGVHGTNGQDWHGRNGVRRLGSGQLDGSGGGEDVNKLARWAQSRPGRQHSGHGLGAKDVSGVSLLSCGG